METIGKRIAALRRAKGLTQDQLAERVGVTAQAVSKWENDNSCPDISILPLIAEVLGVSTDMLLGVTPIDASKFAAPKQASCGHANGEESAHERNGFTGMFDGGKRSGTAFAVAMILTGAIFLLSKTPVWPFAPIEFWSFVWRAVVLAIGVGSLINRVSLASVGISLVGAYLVLSNLGILRFELSWSILWPVLLILVGVSLLIDRVGPRKRGKSFSWAKDVNHRERRMEYNQENGRIHMDCAFGEFMQVADLEEFHGGDVDCSFGKATLDLTACRVFPADCALDVDVSFGECEILLPRTVRLAQAGKRSFGSLEVNGEPYADASMTISINADASFGNLAVKYL